MKRCALLLGLLLTLAVPASAFALREVIVGNQPLGPEFGIGKEVLAAVNIEERVYMYNHNGDQYFFFKGGLNALNEAIRRFAVIPADRREIFLLPIPAKPLLHDKPIAYDWCLHTPSDRPFRGKRPIAGRPATLTIYVPEHLPPPPADAKAARKWIADLGNDDFKVRERAVKELIAIGPPVASLLRDALKGRVAPEARDRMERILERFSKGIRVDVLKLPDGVPVIGLDDLLAQARKKLSDKNPAIRGNGASQLVETGAPADEVLPDIEKLLKTEKDTNALAGAGWAAYHLGAPARPLLPLLRDAAKSEDKVVADICRQAIEQIERSKPEPISEAEVKKRATIRGEIRDYIAGQKGKTGN